MKMIFPGLILLITIFSYSAIAQNSDYCLSDSESPEILSCPKKAVFFLSSSEQLNFVAPKALDNCGILNIEHNLLDLSFQAENKYQEFIKITWTISDKNGNTSLCHQNVSLKDIVFEKNKPSQQHSSANEISTFIYPNPNNGYFHLDLAKISGETEIVITTLSGLKIISLKHDSANQDKATIDLTGITKGIYIIHLKNKNEHYTEKMMVF